MKTDILDKIIRLFSRLISVLISTLIGADNQTDLDKTGQSARNSDYSQNEIHNTFFFVDPKNIVL